MSGLHRKIGVSRWDGSDFFVGQDCIAIEALVTVRINNNIVANLLASPVDLQDLAIGHCISVSMILLYQQMKLGRTS
jgi:formate dehydrogenase assembly factor FdhD